MNITEYTLRVVHTYTQFTVDRQTHLFTFQHLTHASRDAGPVDATSEKNKSCHTIRR